MEPGQTDAIVRVVVDAAGGEAGVPAVLEGVAAALEADPALQVILTGPAEQISPFAAAHPGRVEAVPTTEVIGMGEHPTEAIRRKKDSSIVVGCKLVKEGRAGGFFSAGSTGAIMAAATFGIGRIKGIDRPALSVIMPGATPTVVLDLGANADLKTDSIAQLAQMGVAYSRIAVGVKDPKVGQLNIGEEETKGSLEAQARFQVLSQKVPGFIGNAEGTDLFGSKFDVIVTDGYVGNIALKTLEATAKFILGSMRDAMADSLRVKLGMLALKPTLMNVRDLLSGDAYGGAYLLGVNGVVVIGHGATSPEAVKNGTLSVAQAIREDLVGQIRRETLGEEA